MSPATLRHKPLVTVICLCYNHAPYIHASVQSVIDQSYDNIEIIIVDDGSTDDSAMKIQEIVTQNPQIKYRMLQSNVGNCAAFNKGLSIANGRYIIDLAADDMLHTQRIKRGVESLENEPDDTAINFCDAQYIDPSSNFIRPHYKRNGNGALLKPVPEGDIYAHLLRRYFICAPTLMSRKVVFDTLNGYDEALAYEDFDFLVRSSRKFRFTYTDEVLVSKRILPGSLSTRQYKKESAQLYSTYLICEKAYELNENELEDKALLARVSYELRQAIRSANYEVASQFLSLFKRLKGDIFRYHMFKILIEWKILNLFKG